MGCIAPTVSGGDQIFQPVIYCTRTQLYQGRGGYVSGGGSNMYDGDILNHA